ncbi:hypothetical protein GJV14_13355 [Enterobacteriaceae bacterium RIT697]|uniref:hypothetical protein n=1 Tax=Pantoea endophytica TaxID=92488 RepID=UPI0012AD4216|nr:hypothetical protein [Pantoea endophytica]MRT24928.1 hypothetical protein [Enterobacteriaceae bacterium RIT697]
MWWLLIPVVGAVITAVAASDSSSSSSSSSSSDTGNSRETAAREALEKEQRRNRELNQAALVQDARKGLKRLLADHPTFLKRTQPNDWHTLTAFNLENALSTPATVNNSFSKLRTLLPDMEYVGNDNEVQMRINHLQGEIAELIALSQRLSEELDQ